MLDRSMKYHSRCATPRILNLPEVIVKDGIPSHVDIYQCLSVLKLRVKME